MALIAEAEKAWPTSSSVTYFTFCIEMPCTYICAKAATSASRSAGSAPTARSTVLRHLQLDLANPGDQRAGIVAGAIAKPSFDALPFSAPNVSVISASRISCTALWLKRLQELLVQPQQLFVALTGLTMTLQPLSFCRTFRTLPARRKLIEWCWIADRVLSPAEIPSIYGPRTLSGAY